MTHVGIVALSHPGLGGTFQYTLSMIEALRRLPENRYTIFTSRANQCYSEIGLPVVALPSALSIVTRGVGQVCGLSSSCELFPGVDRLIAPIYTTCLLATRRPFAFTLHDLQEKYYPQYFNLLRRSWRHAANFLLLRSATQVICESAYVKSDIQRFFAVSADRISVISAPPVSSLAEASASEADLGRVRAKLHVPDEFVFYPAQFFAHKNHARLVEAFVEIARQHPRCHLVLTGQTKHEYANVMSRVHELGLGSKVIHLGYLETADLAAIYRMAKLIVIPTLFESISIPVYEAFMLGTPVCASNVVALPEQIGDAGVLFDPESAADMAAKISATLSDDALRSELVSRGKQRIAALTVDRYAQQLRELLDRVK